jgi:hypothetical protein
MVLTVHTDASGAESSRILCNPKFQCPLHNSPPRVLSLSQLNAVHAIPATGWTVWGSNPSGGEIFRTRTHRPWDPPSPYPGVKRPGRGADHPPHLEEVSRAIPLLPLWAFMACCTVNFTTPSHPSTFINVNIILPPTTKSSKWCHSFTFPHQNPVICVTRPAQLIFLDFITRLICG